MNKINCPKCGSLASNLIEGVCRDCFLQHFILAQLVHVLRVKICQTCGAYFSKGRWVNEDNDETALIKSIENSISVNKSAQDVEIDINFEKKSPRLYKARVNVLAKIKGDSINSVLDTEIRIIGESCDRCSRISGGYFEAIIQIRANDRLPTQEEIEICIDIAEKTIRRMENRGDRLAFITDFIKLKEGIDLYIGSTHSGKQICKAIIEILGGTYNESPSLFSQKDGKEIIRMTFSVRLPKYMSGDIISLDDNKIIVKRMDKKIFGNNLVDSKRIIIQEEDINKTSYVNNLKNAINAVIVSEEKDELMVLDPFTFKTVTIKKPRDFLLDDAKEIPVVKIEEILYFVPFEWQKNEKAIF